MLKATAKRYLKRSTLAILRRLPQPVQLRLFCELAGLLGDNAAKLVPGVMMTHALAVDRGLLTQAAPGTVQDGNLESCARIVGQIPVAERGLFLRNVMSRTGVTAAKALPKLLMGLSRPENVSIFQHLAALLEVSGAEVAGSNGRLSGYLDDSGVFVPYFRERTWFWNGVEFINSMFLGRAGGTFIDAGANIGAVVVPVAQANSSVDCFAFEPEPNNFAALAFNIARNRVSENVKAYRVALAEADGVVSFELSGSNFGDHRVRKSGGVGKPVFDEEGRPTIEIEACRLDRVLTLCDLARPIVVKIDVQGAEPMVLAGGETILREAEMVIVEYWPYGMRRLGCDPLEFLNRLSGIFPFAARIGEHSIRCSDFLPFAAMRPDLETFADEHTWMHLNLALIKTPLNEPAGRE